MCHVLIKSVEVNHEDAVNRGLPGHDETIDSEAAYICDCNRNTEDETAEDLCKHDVFKPVFSSVKMCDVLSHQLKRRTKTLSTRVYHVMMTLSITSVIAVGLLKTCVSTMFSNRFLVRLK